MTIGRSVGRSYSSRESGRPTLADYSKSNPRRTKGREGGKKGRRGEGREEEPFHHELQAGERRIGSATAAVARCAAFRVGTFVALFTAA